MLFNSYEFLFIFLPITLFVYYALKANSARLVFLTIASYVFYGWWNYRFCGLLFLSTLVDYLAGSRIACSSDTRKRKLWLIISLCTNLGLLGFFKYFDLFAQTLNQVSAMVRLLPSPLIPVMGVILPVGISFYTFQSMSYTIDVYLGNARPCKSIWSFACYVSLFPQLVAGPIVRYHELAAQLESRIHSMDRVARGVYLFIFGLAKKVILADGVVILVDQLFKQTAPGLISSWAGMLAYAMQIYFDFSGYSDMAAGLGSLFGFEFPRNFNSPYKALSITDFWRRWHISLSSWLRDYLYIPLGGNRKGLSRTYANLLITMMLGGLWHGANWTFLFWGTYHGVWLAIERVVGKRSFLEWVPKSVRCAWTFLIVLGGWVLFRSSNLVQALGIYRGLMGMNGWAGGWDNTLWTTHKLPFMILCIATGVCWLSANTWEIRFQPGLATAVVLGFLFIVCIGIVLVNSSSPFLYFQF
ncbi:MAG: hypothetical protein A2X46_05165 [Lentisphaerae bacterium GWF2_57_35]|nr:MAG: hypothetical protein A2X46_05165 [Lentisphaerae bacterium GWF2_57_35]